MPLEVTSTLGPALLRHTPSPQARRREAEDTNEAPLSAKRRCQLMVPGLVDVAGVGRPGTDARTSRS